MASVAEKDLYQILGVERNATEAAIKKAFRHKARELHPDVNKSPNAEEEFKELNEAYDVLSDANKRAQYDRFGTIPGAAGAGPGYVDFEDIFGGFGGMGDIFSSFFGGAAQGRQVRRDGRDMGLGITVTLKEAAEGISKEVVYDRLAPCSDCDGTGLGPDGAEETCENCNGTGRVTQVQRTFFGDMQSQTTCPECEGTGRIIKGACEECQGQGRVPDRQKVSIDIPKGIRDGQQMRVPDLGEAGMRGADSGDLIVTVRVAEDECFQRVGDDLHVSVSIPMVKAALGARIHVDGIMDDEEVEVRIPEGTQTGDVIKVKGHGMPKLRSNARGNLFVHADVKIPKKLNKKERSLLEKLALEMGEDAEDARTPLEKLKSILG